MRLCIIAGSGDLPIDVANEAKDKGIYTTIIPIESFADQNSFKEYVNVETIPIGKIGRAFKFLKKHNISHILFAGSVKRPSLSSIIPDLEGTKLLARILKNKFLGDDTLLKCVIGFFEENGFQIISPTDILSLNIKKSGSITNSTPSKAELKDIEIGVSTSHRLSELDIGQSLLISEGRIISVEGAEGTDGMIKRSKEYVTPKKSILVKLPKLGQDTRIDMPTIGPKTIELMHKNNIAGIAIDKNVLVLSMQETIDIANLYSIYIYIIETEEI